MSEYRNPVFSFCYGGRDGFSRQTETADRTDAGVHCTRRRFENGLQITTASRQYPEFEATEWVHTLENIGDTPTDLIEDLWDADVSLALPPCPARWSKGAWMLPPEEGSALLAPGGSTSCYTEFFCDLDEVRGNAYTHRIYAGEKRHYHADAGRSSGAQAPFFHIHHKGKGYFLAIGWTGQWRCEMIRESDSLRFRAGMEDCHYRLFPGECYRTASILIMAYEGSMEDGQNRFRRLLKSHFSPRLPEELPLCASIWGGMSTENALERIQWIREQKLPFNYIWMDAGWYGKDPSECPDEFEGEWWDDTGDWTVNPHRHPDGLREVTRQVHEAGLRYILWFEPERAHSNCETAKAHPEYFLSCPERPNDRLLRLGDPAVWQAYYTMLCDAIGRLQIDCYRQDFNIGPLPFWRANDEPDRVGISELSHVNGLYRLWDALHERFPALLIDNCASGGHRLDIEMMRRSIPLWRSDAGCPANPVPEIQQTHNLTFSCWMPYHGTGTGRTFDPYNIRSAYAGMLTTNWTFSAKDTAALRKSAHVALIRRHLEEYKRIRKYFYEDVYPLTRVSDRSDIWCAVQFHRPSVGDGMVQVFKRAESPYTDASYPLRGLHPEADYRVTDLDGGTWICKGADLISGFRVQIAEKRVAKIFLYERLS